MKAILLGAGASKAAGYPLAAELISSIESEARSSRELNLKDAWKQWDQYRQSASGNLHLLLSCQNPEVVLSVPDLCEAARDANDLGVRQEIKRLSELGQPLEVKHVNEYWDSPERATLQEAIDARAQFLNCLHWYFALKHQGTRRSNGLWRSRDAGIRSPGTGLSGHFASSRLKASRHSCRTKFRAIPRLPC
jgi:hypothetical protein